MGIVKRGLFGLVLCASQFAQAQFLQLGDASYSGNTGGPFVPSATTSNHYSRFAILFPYGLLGNMKHGDSISSIEFYRTPGRAFDTACDVKFWLMNDPGTDLGSIKFPFTARSQSEHLVASGKPADLFPPAGGWCELTFNGGAYFYDSTKGKSLVLMCEYEQRDTQGGPPQFYFESGFTVTGYSLLQVHYAYGASVPDSLPNTTQYHPTIRFHYPRADVDLQVQKVYTLGKMPVPLGRPDSAQVLLRNVGKKDISGQKVYTFSKGANAQKDSFSVNLARRQSGFFAVPSLAPAKRGLDTIWVESPDANKDNNKAWSLRLENENVYSYRQVNNGPAPGGIGFNGETGDFVARFYAAQTKYINQINVTFGAGNRQYRLGIWAYNSSTRQPGSLIWQSDTLVSGTGSNILDISKPVQVNGPFFVGVRQLGTSNVAFGYQMEEPVRPLTFFYAAPLGDTTWYDFSPDAPFRFLIEPRLQAEYDLAALSSDFPKDTLNQYSTDTLAPKGTIKNLGVQSIKPDSLEVVCEVWGPQTKLYRESIFDTLSAGQTRQYTFPKKLVCSQLGEYRQLIMVKHLKDSIGDNDTAESKFYVGVKNDVLVATVYDPPRGFSYRYLLDTLMPVATVQNPSYTNSSNFFARCQIVHRSGKVVYNQAQTLQLDRFLSQILWWPTWKCTDTGRFDVIFTTEMVGDSYSQNDTIKRQIWVSKQVDLGLDSAASPRAEVEYSPGSSQPVRLRIFNDGIVGAFGAKYFVELYNPAGQLFYLDSIKLDIGANEAWMEQWKNASLSTAGEYRGLARVRYEFDPYEFNDSFTWSFIVGRAVDLQAKQWLWPNSADTLEWGSGPYAPSMVIQTGGYKSRSGTLICEAYQNGTRSYQSSAFRSLDSAQTDTVTFAQSLLASQLGDLHLRAYWQRDTLDKHPENDSLFFTLPVAAFRDLALLNLSPQPDSLILGFAGWKPQVIVKSLGPKFGTDSSWLRITLTSNTEILLNDTLQVSALQKVDSLILETKDSIKGLLPGDYTLAAYLLRSVDSFPLNDSLKHRFAVRVNNISSPSAASLRVYPQPSIDGRFILENHPEEAYQIYDNSGRLIQSGTAAQELCLATSLPDGTYWLQLPNRTAICLVLQR